MADPKNYTGIFPPSYGGNPITQSLISPLLSPFLRREEIRPEEIQEVAERELGLNPQTGMPEFTSTVEVVPGEYGPIEGGGGITGLLTSGVLNFLKGIKVESLNLQTPTLYGGVLSKLLTLCLCFLLTMVVA